MLSMIHIHYHTDYTMIFHPARTHWASAHGTWTTKGTDLAMAALTSVPRTQRYSAWELRMCEKRRKMNKDESKQSENWCKYRTKQIQTVYL